MTFKAIVAALAAVCALGASASAQAAMIYNNLTPQAVYAGTFWGVKGAAALGGGEAASAGMVFTAGLDAELREMNIALVNLHGAAAGADVSLWTKDLGTQLGSWHIAAMPDFGGLAAPVRIGGISGVHLTAGVDYVLVAAAANPDDYAGGDGTTSARPARPYSRATTTSRSRPSAPSTSAARSPSPRPGR